MFEKSSDLVKRRKAIVLAAAFAVLVSSGWTGALAATAGWQDTFDLESCNLSPNGANSYFYLEPGYRLTLAGQEDGDRLELVMTVTNQTKFVNGVETRVVEEKESENGELVEISMNYMAICKQTGDIFYFGEAVDLYEDGQVERHEGEWLAGQDGANAGLIYPAKPVVGFKYYMEVAPGVAEDRAEIVGLNETLATPAGVFTNVLKVEETTPLEPGEKEYKYYAPDVGLLQDEDLKLVDYVIPKPAPEPVAEMKSQPQQVIARGSAVEIPVNSSAQISGFELDEDTKSISFAVDGDTGSNGLTVIAIGRILEGPYVVTVDGEVTDDYVVTDSGSGPAAIRVNHTGSHDIAISGTSVVPEFPIVLILPAAMIGGLLMLTRLRPRNAP